MKTTIVSAADAGYFPLLQGLVASIRLHQPDQKISLAVMDLGMASAQLQELRSQSVAIVEGRWDFDFPSRASAPRSLQWMTARCHLPKYFPDVEQFIWIDADAWLQDWRAIELLQYTSSGRGVAIVPEIHRAYPQNYGLHAADKKSDNYDFFLWSYGEEVAKAMDRLAVINAGVFAIRSDNPVWECWANWVRRGMNGKLHKLVDQCALSLAIFHDKFPFVPLPAWCDWMCGQALPFYDLKRRCLCESVPPFEPISIVHVTPRSINHMKLNLIGGGSVDLPLDYLEFKPAQAKLHAPG
jgi:glycosyl transferase family 8